MVSDPDDRIELRAKPKVYVVFGVMMGIPALIFLVATLRGMHGALGILGVFVFGGLYAYAWLATYRLEVSTDELRYRELFGGDRRIALDEISKALFEFNNARGRGRSTPNVRLVIEPSPAAGMKPFSINASVFPYEGMELVRKRLHATPLPEDD